MSIFKKETYIPKHLKLDSSHEQSGFNSLVGHKESSKEEAPLNFDYLNKLIEEESKAKSAM